MWQNPQKAVDLVTVTEESFNGKLHLLCSDSQRRDTEKVNLIEKGKK